MSLSYNSNNFSKMTNKSEYRDKDKPTQVRQSNITAAKGINLMCFHIYEYMLHRFAVRRINMRGRLTFILFLLGIFEQARFSIWEHDRN